MGGDKLGDQLPLPKMAIMLLVILIIGVVIWQIYNGQTVSEVGVGTILVKFSNNTVKEISAHENLLASDYHYMYRNEDNLFGVNIALDDSIKEAISDLPTGNVINVIADGKITPTYGNKSNVTMVSTNQPMSSGLRVDLTAPETFKITPATSLTSEAQYIPYGNPGQNFATWKWYVKPLVEGPGTLTIEAYTVDDKGHKRNINSTLKEIEVIAISAPTNVTAAAEKVAAAKENLTAAAEKVAAAKENATAAAPAAAKEQPGFEGVFAIAGLLAAAYLVLGKRE
jgi:PGF-CTERM protein